MDTEKTTIPTVVRLADVEVVEPSTVQNRNRFARIVTAARHGSEVMLGVSWFFPGEETETTYFRDDVPPGGVAYSARHEVYYVVRGVLEVEWDRGTLTVGTDEAIYMPPGWGYRLRNPGDREVFFVYAMCPPIE